MEAKSILFSKVFWFNVVTAVLMLADGLTDTLGPEAVKFLGVVVVVGNVLLRFLTDQPVSLKGKK